MAEYLTIKEVANRIKVHPQTIRNWIRDGTLPASKPKGKIFINIADLNAIMDRNKRG